MFKKICCAIGVLLAAVSVVSAYDWESQKTSVRQFYVNLAGSAPTVAQMNSNFVRSGDVIIDASIKTVYIITDVQAGSYVAIASNGNLSVTGSIGVGNISTGTFVTNVTPTAETGNITGTVTIASSPVEIFDSTGAACSNAAGTALSVYTNIDASVTIYNGTKVYTNLTLTIQK